ncbi:alpha/beta hydrolase [Jannaschia sp. S6380]|uniref:alpha/beta hydrolase n=1 Tax=Jannaschia sp. S6380 TaxID=2926408 RepID=UPI001FF58A84|nr:alpha/beta hydrolase [Jannaschia sp. S6380]MCK0166509.1 alpha/beta hydrolase [Jannaschia sp. S6380]
MRRIGTWAGRLLALVLLALAALWLFGPREAVDTDVAFDASSMPDDLDGWLADREGQVPDLDPEARKRILWAGAPGDVTDLAIVYLHGFSATSWELRPVPNMLGERLGANVYLTRLTGHGRTGAALARADAGDWVEDLAQAMAIGRAIGRRVVVIGTSTGGTLAGVLATDPDLVDAADGLAGVVFVSPNFRVANPAARLLSWPLARHWLPLVAGRTRSFTPMNARHARHWTTEYPTRALLPMQALIDHADGLDWSAARSPALFLFAPEDTVVDHAATERVAAGWGPPAAVRRVAVPPGDDPDAHVIAGDILSPGGTQTLTPIIAEWIADL